MLHYPDPPPSKLAAMVKFASVVLYPSPQFGVFAGSATLTLPSASLCTVSLEWTQYHKPLGTSVYVAAAPASLLGVLGTFVTAFTPRILMSPFALTPFTPSLSLSGKD